ncbi:hypothetical protein [Thiohalorhabdus methylotrophus]|uniref:Uncharacterized protein n=1 Tax=Thiohalorhabdus methylotrophus TaxID=3242694 RepID=A0ABV4TU72_9GAMM
MYKRKGRILFLDPERGELSGMAAAWAGYLGDGWVEAGAAAWEAEPPSPKRLLPPDLPGPLPEPVPWSSTEAAAWDLVVALAGPECPDWTGLLSGYRHKVWRLGGECGRNGSGAVDTAACSQELRRRVLGLVGGFRMKAREDAGPGAE